MGDAASSAELDRLMHYDDLVARVYADERMVPGTREVALAMAWALERSPDRMRGREFWATTQRLLGCDRIGRWRLWELVADDAPRYERRGRYSQARPCEGPRHRPYKPRRQAAGNSCLAEHHPHIGPCRFTQVHGASTPPPRRDDTICGAAGVKEIIEQDLVTGWHRSRWFCRRHLGRATEVAAQLAAANAAAPEPIPNVGGILPRYFKADWAAIYTHYTGKVYRRWEPPFYGIDADGWPVPGKQPAPKRPRLSVVTTVPTSHDARGGEDDG